jgi:Membrane bound O-acyl transferase family
LGALLADTWLFFTIYQTQADCESHYLVNNHFDHLVFYRMAAIVSLQLLAMKTIVLVESYTGKPSLNFVQWLVFAQAWFGMRPILFERLFSKALPDIVPIFAKGISRIAIGFLLLYASKQLENQHLTLFFLPDLLMLIGLSLILHFGILNICTALFRFLGVDVKELFRAPYKSKSLKEFWGRRWNMAFSEMTALVAYRPLKDKYGKNNAMICSFLLSGIVHEIAISCPVKSGYGLPLLYFVIHGVVMYAEGEVNWIKKIINHKILAHIWVFGWLILPTPLLFHKAFLTGVLVPLRDIILGSVFTNFN